MDSIYKNLAFLNAAPTPKAAKPKPKRVQLQKNLNPEPKIPSPHGWTWGGDNWQDVSRTHNEVQAARILAENPEVYRVKPSS